MIFASASWLMLLTTLYLTLVCCIVAEKQGIEYDPNLRPRHDQECPDGFGGINCKENVDECKGLPYPCAGGTKRGSFCVDYNPQEKFKCGCLPGYDAILVEAMKIKDPVPVEWRPLKCVPRDVCVDFLCHDDATCIVSSSNTAVCICNDNLIGDGITNCSPPAKAVVKKPASPSSLSCEANSDCIKLENSGCLNGFCECNIGFYRSNGRGKCLKEDQCAYGYPNDCHRNSICKNTEDSYTCTCKEGYHDLNPANKPGTVCAQTNECLDPTMNDCNSNTQVCLDHPPPLKWQCVERTPSPTAAPIPAFPIGSCINDKIGTNRDTGCTQGKPYCLADQNKVGKECAFCINDKTGSQDQGCPSLLCVKQDGTIPALDGGGDKCVVCVRPPIVLVSKPFVIGSAQYGCTGKVCIDSSSLTAPKNELDVGDDCAVCLFDDTSYSRDIGCPSETPYCNTNDFEKAGSSCRTKNHF